MLARRLILAFLTVILPGVMLLGAGALYWLDAARRVNDRRAEIVRMAALLRPAVTTLRETGRALFAADAAPREPRVVARAQTVRRAVADVHEQIERMSGVLLRHVEDLGAQSQALGRRASILTASLAVGIALLAGTAAVAIARHITHPLNELLAGIRRMMAGDWSSRVRVAPGGEIGELASSFNAMVDEVGRHRQRLEEYGRTLEERVRQRTEELNQKDQAPRRSIRPPPSRPTSRASTPTPVAASASSTTSGPSPAAPTCTPRPPASRRWSSRPCSPPTTSWSPAASRSTARSRPTCRRWSGTPSASSRSSPT